MELHQTVALVKLWAAQGSPGAVADETLAVSRHLHQCENQAPPYATHRPLRPPGRARTSRGAGCFACCTRA